MKTTTLITLCTLTMTLGVATAGDDGAAREAGKAGGRRGRSERAEHPGGEAIKAFMQGQRQLRMEHMKSQGAETKALLETLRDGDPNEGCTAMLAHSETQHSENTAFVEEQQAAAAAFFQQQATENDIPEAKVAEHTERMLERQAEMEKRHEERYQKHIAALTELSNKEDLTWDEVRKTMQATHQGDRRRGGEGRRKRGGKRKCDGDCDKQGA